MKKGEKVYQDTCGRRRLVCWSKTSTDVSILRTVQNFLNANAGKVIMVTGTLKNTNSRMYLDNTYYSAYLININGIGQLSGVADEHQGTWPIIAPPQPPIPRPDMVETPRPRHPSKRSSEPSDPLSQHASPPVVLSFPECDGTCADPDDYAMCSKSGKPHAYPCPLCGGAMNEFCLGEKDTKGMRGGPFRGKAHNLAIQDIQEYIRSQDKPLKKPKTN